MDPDKVMEDPVDIEALLEALFLFGVGVGFSAIGCTPSAQGGIKGLQMIGVNLGVLNRRRGLRMPPARGLVFRPLAAALMGAGALVFNSNLNAFGQGPRGTPALAGADHCRTQLEQHLTITTFPIGNQREIPGGVDHVD